jgi:hypothetical protein
MSIAAYTVITAGKDPLIKQDFPVTAFVDAYDRFTDPRRNSRIQKILAHKYFDDEFTIYFDGNMKLIMSPEEVVARYMDGFDMAIFKHPSRDCVYDECLKCAQLKMDDPEVLIAQAKYYEDHEYPKHRGLCEGGFIVRRNNARTRAMNETWWADFCVFSRRDQISLMPAIVSSKVVVNVLPDQFRPNAQGEWTRGGIVSIVDHRNFDGNFNDPKLSLS